MPDREKVIAALHCRAYDDDFPCWKCAYYKQDEKPVARCDYRGLMDDAMELLKEQEKEIKALRLLVEWATDCDFGFDQFPEEYERYKDEITDMKYIDGMVHVAKRTLEDHGAFEEGR